ncbi:hypothetical protein, partial [Pantoea agglomerans]|uniref:hypothetical protein n=1 Tax=Enterobacter agglomerans TaxID=549 RepID=UPI003C7A49A3
DDNSRLRDDGACSGLFLTDTMRENSRSATGTGIMPPRVGGYLCHRSRRVTSLPDISQHESVN